MTLRLPLLTAAVLAALLLFACGGDDDDSDGASSSTGNDTPASAATEGGDGEGDGDDDEDDGGSQPSGGGGDDFSDIEPCTLLEREEVEAAVGNSVEDGAVDFGISCKWDSEPEETSVAVYFLAVAGSLCEQALANDPVYSEAEGFDAPAFTSYNDTASIGQSDVVICLEGGQMQLIVTGGVGVEPDEAALRQAAEELTKLVLSRL